MKRRKSSREPTKRKRGVRRGSRQKEKRESKEDTAKGAKVLEEKKEDLALFIFTKAKKKVKVHHRSHQKQSTATAAITTSSVNLPRDNATIHTCNRGEATLGIKHAVRDNEDDAKETVAE
ncbi:hypothetical protein ACFX14_030478 [Malus domestica]